MNPEIPNIFKPGKITFVLDGGAGSSAKGGRGAHIWSKYRESHTKFAVNTFMENAAHTITHPDGKEVIHQCLSSVTTLPGWEKQYLSPGCVFAKETFLKELKTIVGQFHMAISPCNIGIHPITSIVTPIDVGYEKGTNDFDGNPKAEQSSLNLKIGSTLHGVGSARARRVLRRPDAQIARNTPELKSYLCETHKEIMERLNNGESGLGEIAQGYQLSLFSQFYPRCTSRNCSISAFLDDSLLPPSVAGPVVVNFRTFPIRVNSNKYIRKSDKKILTWTEWQATPWTDRELIKGDSGAGYSDQKELSWEEISKNAGEEIFEQTSLTKLPRRVFSWSRENFLEAMIYNNTGDDMYVSINFLNYVDASVKGERDPEKILTPKVVAWLKENIFNKEVSDVFLKNHVNICGLFLGTWKSYEDSVYYSLQVPKLNDNLEPIYNPLYKKLMEK